MANNAVTAKARAIHGKLLNRDDYVTLMHKGTIPQAVAYLRTKPLYTAVFAEADEAQIRRAQAEQLINKNVFDNYIRVAKFSAMGKDSILSFLIRQLEAEQLIKAVIAINSGNKDGFVAAFPDYMTKHFCFDPIRLAGEKELSGMVEQLKGTMYHKPLKNQLAEAPGDVNRLVTTINVCYIKWAFDRIDSYARGETRETLKNFFLRKIDADNLLMCYRMKSTFGAGAAEIHELLIPYHRKLRPVEIDDALKTPDPVAALRDMFVSQHVVTAEVSDIPEVNINVSDHRYFRHCLAVSKDEVESLYSLMMLFRDESTNLCRIIEGLRYSVAPEEIEKYLII